MCWKCTISCYFHLKNSLYKHLDNLAVTWQSVWVIFIHTHIIIHKLQGWYTVYSDGCVIHEVEPTITTYLKYDSTITSWINNMLLSLMNNIITIQFWLCVNTVPTRLLLRTAVLILCPWSQWILVYLMIFGEIWNLLTLRREYVCVVEFWACSFIY